MRCYGLALEVATEDGAILERLVADLPPGARPVETEAVNRRWALRVAGVGRPLHEVLVDGEVAARAPDLGEALERLHSDLRLYVAAHARRRLFVHAGVVAWRGRAILMPGRSLAGKSTLTAALVRLGATYFSDEYAVLDERGRVHPFGKPLSLRDGAGRQHDVAVEALGGVAGRGPLPVGLVVATAYRDGARFRPRALSPGETVLALFDNTVAAQHAARRALAVLRAVSVEARAVRGARGEAEAAARAILRLAGRERRDVELPPTQC